MGWLAQSVLDGLGLSSPFGVPTGPTAFIAPAYPLLVAGVFKLLGSYSVAAEVALMTLNIAANLLTIWLVMRLARRFFGAAAATVAGLLWACALPLLWMPTIFWETSLSTCMMTALVTAAVELRPKSAMAWLLLGAAGAVASLINPALLPVLCATLLWMAYRSSAGWQPRLARLALAAAALALVFSPWPLRNARVFHAFIPLRTTVGFELWMGNHPGSDGYLDETLFPAANAQELAQYKRLGEVAYTSGKQALAEDYIRKHPVRFLELTGIRALRFWSGMGNRTGSPVFEIYGLFTGMLGCAGLWMLVRRRGWRQAMPLLLPLLLFPLPYCITHAEFRYRLVVDPLLTALAGGALVAIWRAVTPAPAAPAETRAEQLVTHSL